MPDGIQVEGTHDTIPEPVPTDTEILDWVLRTGAVVIEENLDRFFITFTPNDSGGSRTGPDASTIRDALSGAMKMEQVLIQTYNLAKPKPYLDMEYQDQDKQAVSKQESESMKRMRLLAGIGPKDLGEDDVETERKKQEYRSMMED